MIARNKHNARALAGLAQKLLQHVVVRLRPHRPALQPPEVDDIADEVERVGIVVLEEIEERLRLARAGSEVHVGDEDRTIAARLQVAS